MNRPRDAWKQFMTGAGSFDKAAKLALDIYKKKYSPRGDAKENKEQFNDKLFVAGKMYSFAYLTKSTPTPERPFIDRFPVFLSMGQMESLGKIYEIGIDFMLVPFEVRPVLLDAVYNYFGKIIVENERDLDEGRKGKKAIPISYEVAKKLFYKMGWQMAFQTYDRTKIDAVAVYDYDDWVTVVPLYTQGVEGMQIGKIYDAYIKRIMNPPDPVTELTQAAKAAEKIRTKPKAKP